MNKNWQAAARDLEAHAFLLYIYLASNANNYKLALSPAAIFNAVGMPRSTYNDQFKKLVQKGYLVPRHGSTYDFYEIPKKEENSLSPDVQGNENSTNDEQVMAAAASDCTTIDREINNSTNNKKIKV